MQITLAIRFDNADIHATQVADANENGGLTVGNTLNTQGYDNALTGSV
jgi:hypothetical protein